jgi:hypothetical protein
MIIEALNLGWERIDKFTQRHLSRSERVYTQRLSQKCGDACVIGGWLPLHSELEVPEAIAPSGIKLPGNRKRTVCISPSVLVLPLVSPYRDTNHDVRNVFPNNA